MAAPRYRSLNLAQTLDEILAVSGKGSADSDRHSLNSPARPPTRHGRESASAGSSNEENKEPSPKSPLTGEYSFQTMRVHDGLPRPESENDDFLSKLNALRRRSLVASGDAADRKIPNGEEKNTRDLVRQRNEIKEESDEEKAESRRPSTSSSRKTFRIGESSSATVLFKEQKKDMAKQKLSPKYMGTPSTSDGTRLEDGSNHSKWLRRKMEADRERRRAEEEEKMKQKQADDEKKKNAQRTFEKWKEMNMEKTKETKKEEKKKGKQLEEQRKEKEKQKKEDAQKTFESWKTERERRMNEEKKRKTVKEKEERTRKEEEARTKREEAEKAFLAWKAKKEEKAEEEKASTRPKQKELEERKRRQEEYKEMVAQQAFETWMELKDVQYQQEQLLLDMPILETRPAPWIPPSNTVPRQFTPNTNRRRKSLDRRPRLTSASTVRRSNSAKSVRR